MLNFSRYHEARWDGQLGPGRNGTRTAAPTTFVQSSHCRRRADDNMRFRGRLE